MTEEATRRPCPFGKPRRPYAATCIAADRPPLIGWNRYPGQIIGVGIRLPSFMHPGPHGHPYLSIVWARPSRWWK